MLSEKEMHALKEIHKNQLITKIELRSSLASKKIIESPAVLDSIINSLVGKNLISQISPVGSVCYAITQKGSQTVNGF